MKPIALFTLALGLWAGLVLAGCVPQSAPAPAALATSPAPIDPVEADVVAGLLQMPVPTHRPAKAAPPLPDVLPVATSTVSTTGSSLAALLPTLTPTPAVDAQGRAGSATVNVRAGPGTHYPVVGKLAPAGQVQIVGRTATGDWLRVCCPAGATVESWVSAEYVTPILPAGLDLTAVPVAAIPPTPAAAVGGAGGQSAASLAAASAVGLPGPGNFSPPGGVNPLTGLPGGSGGRPLIVCINNDYAARPQFGLSQADVVYEYLMEGYGITRFSAIFYGQDSSQIGPVRSARLINYTMGALYDAGLVCSGASDSVRYALKHQAPFPYMDIDLDDGSNTRYSVSIGTDYRTRLRTGTDKLRRWLADWGVDKAPAIRGFTFGSLPGGGAPATSLSIPYPRATGSQAAFTYDVGSGRYLRSMGGGAHVDGNTGAQIAVENVIVQVVAHEATDIVEDSLGSTSIRLNLFGSGPAYVLRDGQLFVGTWRSDSRGDMPHFVDAAGAEIPLKPGKSWISIVPPAYSIGYP